MFVLLAAGLLQRGAPSDRVSRTKWDRAARLLERDHAPQGGVRSLLAGSLRKVDSRLRTEVSPEEITGDGAESTLERSRHACHVVLDEEEVDDGYRQAAEERSGHQGAPLVDVSAHELGREPHRHRLVLRRG